MTGERDREHVVPDVEYVAVCELCWRRVHRNDADNGWEHDDTSLNHPERSSPGTERGQGT